MDAPVKPAHDELFLKLTASSQANDDRHSSPFIIIHTQTWTFARLTGAGGR
jgi:hypothetical protein